MKTTFTLLEKNMTFLIGARREDQRCYLLDLNLNRVRRPVNTVTDWTRCATIATMDTPTARASKKERNIFKWRLKKDTLSLLSGK
jgi:hypothetical protein